MAGKSTGGPTCVPAWASVVVSSPVQYLSPEAGFQPRELRDF